MFESIRNRKILLLIYFLLLIYLFTALFPLIWTFLCSIKLESELLSKDFNFFPHFPTLENYIELFSDRGNNFISGIGNSFVVASITSVSSIVVATMAAYACSRYKFRGRKQIMAGYLFMHLFPSVLLLLPIYVMFSKINLINSRLGLSLAYCTFSIPFAVWMLTGSMNGVPIDMEEAARIDGCNRLKGFIHVVFPTLAPSIVAVLVYVFINAWNEFLYANIFLNDKMRTIPIVLYSYIDEYFIDWGKLTSGGVIAGVPVIIVFMLVQKGFVSGLTAGSVKG